MKRRELIAGIASLPFLARSLMGQTAPNPRLIKPKRLKRGDTLGVIAPSSGLVPEAFEKALQNLHGLGFKTAVGKYARNNIGLFSAKDSERLHDLHWAFKNNEIDGIWCVRGGDGAPRILPDLDFELIKRNPKVFVGYSDITALHLAISQKCGLVTFHGPVGTSEYSEYTRKRVLEVLTEPANSYQIGISQDNQANPSPLYKTEVIVSGKCRGTLIGGNLSLLSALAGTPYALTNLKGKILFIEDVDEHPYRVDRMLTQLRQSANMRSLAGIALGIFENCNPTEKKPFPQLIDVIRDRLGDLGVPVIYGLSFGHVRDQCTLPIGIKAELSTDDATIRLLERAVE